MSTISLESTQLNLAQHLGNLINDPLNISEYFSQNRIYLEDVIKIYDINAGFSSFHLLNEHRNAFIWLATLNSSHKVKLPAQRYHRFLYILEGRVKVVKQQESKNEKIEGECFGVGEFISILPNSNRTIVGLPNQNNIKILNIIYGIKINNNKEEIKKNENKLWKNQRFDKALNPRDGYYYGYDDRYKDVYKAGAHLWETDVPNEVICQLVPRLPLEGKKIIDLGCGEGRDTIYLASQGYDVLGVDVSHNALEKARSIAYEKGFKNLFLERDIIYLRNIPNNTYDLALNMGCLHMLDDQQHRRKHLARVFEILKPNGLFLLSHCKEGWLKGFWSVEDASKVGEIIAGKPIERRIRTPEGIKKILLPLLPYKEADESVLSQELREAGFNILQTVKETTFAFGNTAIIVSQKSSSRVK